MNTILLIEDNHDIRENTAELLEVSGYEVISAENGATGLSLAKSTVPDIILCDIEMPVTSGYEVFNSLKNDPRTSAIPFIFLTASAERKEVEAGLGMGANGYVRKPFETKELIDTIEECLKGKN